MQQDVVANSSITPGAFLASMIMHPLSYICTVLALWAYMNAYNIGLMCKKNVLPTRYTWRWHRHAHLPGHGAGLKVNVYNWLVAVTVCMMATRYIPGASSIEIPLRDTDEVNLYYMWVTCILWIRCKIMLNCAWFCPGPFTSSLLLLHIVIVVIPSCCICLFPWFPISLISVLVHWRFQLWCM